MTTLLTGASGFIGSAVLRQLLKHGHRVRALVRKSSNTANIKGLSVEIVNGDLNDIRSLKRAMHGCDSLFHVAADYRLWALKPAEIYQTNVRGTRNIMIAAMDAGVKRVVYTSSVATIGLPAKGDLADETTPSDLHDMLGHYKRSKFMAEKEVQWLVREEGLPAVIVNPSTPIGPRDIKPTPTGRIIVEAASGRMPAYVNTGLNLVHVDDVAKGHLLAYDHGTVGERYILGGVNMTLKEILEEIAAITGLPAPKICLPHNLILPVAYISEAIARLIKKNDPFITVDGVKMAKKNMFFSTEKAKRALGYKTRPVTEALEDAINWFRDNGYLVPGQR